MRSKKNLLPRTAQRTVKAFCDKRAHYGPKDRTSLQAQINLQPRTMTLKFHLAELPAQFDMANDAETRFTTNKAQSGPYSLRKRLCNEVVKQELALLNNFSVLAPNVETVLTNTIDNAFPIDEPPEKRFRAQSRALSSSSRIRQQQVACSSSTGSQSRALSPHSRPGQSTANSSSSSSWQQPDWNTGWSETWSERGWWGNT